MSHNLVISNDKESEYVQFTVHIPDGYNKYNVAYINGSLINQNYLKVGDVLKFSFDNNPLYYRLDANTRLIYNEIVEEEEIEENVEDIVDYKFIKCNFYKYHRIVYIPIYQAYNALTGTPCYIFNPCDNTQLLLEPVKRINPFLLYQDAFSTVYATFTGKYVIGLKSMSENKIPDITLTIGESISNSKTRPQEMGAYQISSNVVNEVQYSGVTPGEYSYGSVWDYEVQNLQVTHTESVKVKYPNSVKYNDVDLLISEISIGNENVVKQVDLSDGFIIKKDGMSLNGKYECKEYNNGTVSDLRDTLKFDGVFALVNSIPLIQQVSPGKYTTILSGSIPLDLILDEGLVVKGENISANNLYTYNGALTPRAIDINSTDKVFISDWYYTGLCIHLKILGSNDKPLKNTEITFPDVPTRYNLTNQIISVGGTNLKIQLYNMLSKKFEYSGTGTVVLCGKLKTDKNGELNVVKDIYTGETSENDYIKYFNEPPTDMLSYKGNEEMFVRAIQENGEYGLEFSTNELKNYVHEVSYTITEHEGEEEDDEIDYTVTNTIPQWGNALPLLCFIPLKTKRFLREYNLVGGAQGFYIINDMDGNVSQQLINYNSEVYIPNGHETLIVEPPAEDDKKFKTFNGTLVFDRSNSRITRIFSNDLTGACVGYLNDLLAARLSRYYYVCDYRTWDMFFDTNNDMNISNDFNLIENIYRNHYTGKLYQGAHELLITSSCDLVKLIASENTINNCIPSLYPEEQIVNTSVMDRSDLYNDSGINDSTLFYYKFFHYYTSGLRNYPYIGTDINDNPGNTTTTGGLNILKVETPTYCDYGNNDNFKGIGSRPVFIMDKSQAEDIEGDIYLQSSDKGYYSNSGVKDYYFIETLPCFRIYRNSNFEQTDLTITTGGIKLLHPIYLQSSPRILCQNLHYIFDYILNFMASSYQSIVGRVNVDLGLLHQAGQDSLSNYLNQWFPMRRYYLTPNLSGFGAGLTWTDFDTFFVLNFIHPVSVNEYQNNEEIKTSIPGQGIDNEEIVKDFETNSVETNIQLFSYKYFNFISEVSYLALVVFDSKYVETIPYNTSILGNYFSWMYEENNNEEEDEEEDNNNNKTIQLSLLKILLNSYITNSSGYNNLKRCKIFITKLGEFLDFPRLLYGCSESQVNSLNVSVWNYNMTKTIAPLKTTYTYSDDNEGNQVTRVITDNQDPHPEQKVNTYLFGTVFRYHQLAHGYQNFANEITDDFIISKSLGNRTFVVTLYDEFGRRFPNEDTSQGFKNNLYLELYLE